MLHHSSVVSVDSRLYIDSSRLQSKMSLGNSKCVSCEVAGVTLPYDHLIGVNYISAKRKQYSESSRAYVVFIVLETGGLHLRLHDGAKQKVASPSCPVVCCLLVR